MVKKRKATKKKKAGKKPAKRKAPKKKPVKKKAPKRKPKKEKVAKKRKPREKREKLPVSKPERKEREKQYKKAKKNVAKLNKKVKKAKGRKKQQLEADLAVARRRVEAYHGEHYRAQTQDYLYPGMYGPPWPTEGEVHNYPGHMRAISKSLGNIKTDIDFIEGMFGIEVNEDEFLQARLDQAELDWSFANKAFDKGFIDTYTFTETEMEFRKIQKHIAGKK